MSRCEQHFSQQMASNQAGRDGCLMKVTAFCGSVVTRKYLRRQFETGCDSRERQHVVLLTVRATFIPQRAFAIVQEGKSVVSIA